MTLVSRPPLLPDELPALAALSARSETLDQLDFASTVPALEGIFARPGLDPQQDARVWLDGDEPVAFALLDLRPGEMQLDGMLWLRVLPERRTDALGQELIAWGVARLDALGAERAIATQLASGASEDDTWRQELLRANGFQPIRHFFRMERPLDHTLEPPAFPPDFTVRTVAGDHEAEAWAELFNQAFVDHWNHHPLSAERLRGIWAEPLYRRELDLVVVAPDETLAAFCACERNPDDPEGAGWIEVLGTRRGYRGRGLGRAALLAGLERLRGDRALVARLIVDAASPTGATRLYEAVGFRVTRRTVRLAQPTSEAGNG